MLLGVAGRDRPAATHFLLSRCIDRRHKKHMCGDMGNTCLVSVLDFQCVQIDSHKPVVAEKYIKRAIMFGIGLEGNGQLE